MPTPCRAPGTCGTEEVAPLPPIYRIPPFAPGAVSDQQLADIYAFLKSVAPPPSASETLTGNADNGNCK